MTVITTIISRQCIAFATDSFITWENGKIEDTETSKIVEFPKLRAAACYWGLSQYKHTKWSTTGWLISWKSKASQYTGYSRPLEQFVADMRDDLDAELNRKVPQNKQGIGIQIAGYEYVDGHWIPELFVCSNFKDPSYQVRCCLHLTRETFRSINNVGHSFPLTVYEHNDVQSRQSVNQWLHSNEYFMRYNNGDPVLYNIFANSVIGSISELKNRKVLRARDSDFYGNLALHPIMAISDVQRDFVKDKKRLVGGKSHDLVILPNGQFISKQNDNL